MHLKEKKSAKSSTTFAQADHNNYRAMCGHKPQQFRSQIRLNQRQPPIIEKRWYNDVQVTQMLTKTNNGRTHTQHAGNSLATWPSSW
jgi:hypothetical protein